MLYPIKVVDLELSRSISTIEGLEGYMGLRGLVRLHGVPLGYIDAPIILGCCTAETLSKLILEQHAWAIICQLLKNGLASSHRIENLRIEDLINLSPAEHTEEWPLVTVAVCTRDRPDDIKLCLEALNKLDYPNLDILIVDNAPQTAETQQLIKSHYPHVRYVCEPRPGLDWARNRAIIEAKGDIVAYTDDDVVVDPGWVKGLAKVFAENPDVMAVTGLVVPYELETETQVLFEEYGGFGRGFEQKWFRVGKDKAVPWYWLGTGQFGTGANMAYRRSIFETIGQFDPALDVGTATNGAGDLEMFFRVLKSGHTLVYEPLAMVRHRHRREYSKLRTQLRNNGSMFAYILCSMKSYPEQGLSFVMLVLWWSLYWNLRRLIISLLHPIQFPRDLILAEFIGEFTGFTTYPKAKRRAVQIANSIPSLGNELDFKKYARKKPRKLRNKFDKTVEVRVVELSEKVQPLSELEAYDEIQVFATWKGKPISSFKIENNNQNISAGRLINEVTQHIGVQLFDIDEKNNAEILNGNLIKSLKDSYLPTQTESKPQLPTNIPVSVVVATCDRPHDLHRCIESLIKQKTTRPLEIIIVDNRPGSGITPPVVAEFPDVILVSESRSGVSYARNAGIAASTGEIIVTTDDDVKLSENWLERLIEPFVRPDVMAVTGNVLPLELKHRSQQLYESYGGLGRGVKAFEVNGKWFDQFEWHAVPTWDLGGTANSAYRASLFCDPKVGLMHEMLGPGMPSGVGEDSYLFYKILKAGYTFCYQPEAYVWHQHRTTMKALRKQIFNYSKGHVSHHLTTIFLDADWRALVQLLTRLPAAHLWKLYSSLRGWTDYPISLVMLEIWGNLAGPWSLLMSYLRILREGRSQPYIRPDLRVAHQTDDGFSKDNRENSQKIAVDVSV